MNYFSIAIMFLIGGLSQVHSAPEEPACVNAKPICTADGANFLAATDTAVLSSESTNNYGCLGSEPNPAWFYLRIDESGDINMSLSAPSDIDFIIWGPFNTLTDALGSCNGGLNAALTVDCSYSGTASETPTITSAQSGEIYILLVTNYSNSNQDISLTKTSGSGTTSCKDVVELPPTPLPTPPPTPLPTPLPSNAPSSSPTFESVSHEMCGDFAVHARTTVTFAGVTSTIQDGDVGVYPGTSITGSYQFVNGGNTVLNSPAFADHVVNSHASAMAGNYGTSETAMAIEIGGSTFLPGIYRSGSAINFAYGTVVTLDGNNEANPEFIFIAGSTLVTAADTYFDLQNGAKAENVVWVLGTAATLGARSHVAGSIMAGTAITFGTNSKLYGCALAQSAVTFESGGSVAIDHYEDMP